MAIIIIHFPRYSFRRHRDLKSHINIKHLKAAANGMTKEAIEGPIKAMSRRVFSHRVDPDEEDEDYETNVQRVGWFSEQQGDMAPIILYNCKLCLVTMLQPIHMHFHLISDHGVEMRMLRNFYKVIDRSDDSFNRHNYETERYLKQQDPTQATARLWFLCYMCGTIMGQEVSKGGNCPLEIHRITSMMIT